ncbi:efflux RND transporter periplasmic adaptor subunit [Photobacterium sp. NCIMB 13483]|uniref:Efflux RND transporter periplasmic adaptor subunit n=1 Tax=Photobacterium piscicola TaxID=1378299 RepID=A0A1T5HYP0_9GAMM|nr:MULTISPECIES: efflux RND transporter periplasmic adaptor subunit [Photobacterium]MEC6822215.1 efflux RND transporter periplasmic adaptor subunit [Photobacterium piscicola]MEC6881107.1 efflux RND transporter periplasmic adaptor subunit [Photobacterium piscicola]MEC6897378.1 efflux RND transporter periplasmic adaptor subunit [Photobacterium piscicola]PST95000.1 efflux RND transporter periplasmic adaptor subunit [Photobacterium sp. NCIMB 13483]SKC31872.1 Solvent efflux pump periplasmic linker 
MIKCCRLSVLSISIALLVVGCDKPTVEPREELPLVKVQQVKLSKQVPKLTFPAVASAADKSILSFRIAGEVTQILVRSGDRVKKGQVLARLDPSDFKLEVDDAQAKYNVNNSQYRRSATLLKNGYLPQSQFDELKAKRSIAKANLDLAQLKLSFTVLKAPFSGVISIVPVEQFENVKVGQQIMNIHSTDSVDIEIQAPDMIYSKQSILDVDKGQRATAKAILPNGEKYAVILKEFTTEPDPESGSFLVTLTMPMPKNQFILDGMSVEVEADAQKLQVYTVGQQIVPLEALFNLDGDDITPSNKYVWVLAADNTVSKRQVVTDKVVPEGVRLKSGVKEGEKVVVTGVNRLRDGQKVVVFTQEEAL